MKIDSCIIVKNEESNIGNLINQLLEFSNEVHITDTGSTDNTLTVINDIIKEHSNLYLHHFDWEMDFSKARNYSLTCYECNADYQFWCDADDLLNDKLLESLKEFRDSTDKDADIYFMKYQYYKGDKNPHNRTSMLKVSAQLKWNDPIHEYIQYTTKHKIDYELFNNGSLILHQRPPHVVHNDRNLKIFMQMERDKRTLSCRNRFYYGRELSNDKLYEYSKYQLRKCIDSEENNRLDKINAAIKLFDMNDEYAVDYFFKLFKIGTIRKDLFYKVASYYWNKKMNDLAELYYILCVTTADPIPSLTFGYNKDAHNNSLLQLGVIAYRKGNINQSINYNKQILLKDPNNKTAKDNIELLEKKLIKK